MNKLKDWVNRGKEMIIRAREGKLTSEDRTNIIIISVTLLCIIAMFFLILKFWFEITAVIAIGYILRVHFKPKKPIPPPTDTIVYNTLFIVLYDIHDRIDARKAIDLMDIAFIPSTIQKNDIEMVRAKITRTKQHPLSEEELEIVRKRLQGRINEHLLSYKRLGGNQSISPDGNAPIIFIDSVMDNVINYLVDVVYIDSQTKLNYYYKKYGMNKHNRPTGDDKDF